MSLLTNHITRSYADRRYQAVSPSLSLLNPCYLISHSYTSGDLVLTPISRRYHLICLWEQSGRRGLLENLATSPLVVFTGLGMLQHRWLNISGNLGVELR